jgi:methyl-accepting chemotaxis protein
MSYSKWSLYAKFTSILVVLGIGQLFLAGLGLHKLRQEKDTLDNIVQVLGKKVTLSNALQEQQKDDAILIRDYIDEDDPTERKTTLGKMNDAKAELLKTYSELSKIVTDQGKADLKEWHDVYGKYWETLQKSIASADSNNRQQASHTLRTEAASLRKEMNDMLEGIASRNESRMNEAIGQAEQEYHQSVMNVIALIVTCFTVSSIMAFYVIRNLKKAIDRIVAELTNSSSQVAGASHQVATSSEQLSSAAQEQASSVEEISASLTEIAGMAESNLKVAESASSSANEVYGISTETQRSMDQLSQAMQTILESNGKIVQLVKVIEEIGEKTEIIDEIVFKTQLLSFNASVEAERAGEHGRGFAVVAQEVGNLAQMSGKAALEISSIVKSSIKEAESVATENKTKVELGGNLANETKAKMEQVLSRLSSIQESVNKIVAASREQGQGINQVTGSIDLINQATQETASNSEESASASTELSSQANMLLQLVTDLKTVVMGASSTAQTPSPSTSHAPQVEEHPKNVLPMRKTKTTARSAPSPKVATAAGNAAVAVNSEIVDQDDAWEKL